MEEPEKKLDSSSESDSSSSTSPIPEASSRRKSQETDVASASGSGKRKAKSSCSSSKKKGESSKDKMLLDLSMAGPSTSKATWSSSSSEREECPICRKRLGRKPTAVPDCCNHSFCYECISAWVTKAKSNCPMDRKDIKLLKVYDKGKLITSEVVEHKVPEEEEVGPEDEGEICPDCGWIGIRPSIGVCLHCMFHHDHPWPVDDCPQCMEAESNASDEEWEPASTFRFRRRIIHQSDSSEVEVLSSEEESAVATSESENEDDDDDDDDDDEGGGDVNILINLSEFEEEEEEEALQAEPVASTSVRRAPVRRKTKRKVTRKKRRTVKRKTTATRRKTATKRKRKVKKRTTATSTATKRKRKTTARRTTRKKRKVTLRTRRRQSRRQIAPSDSAKARLAKLLGLRPPRDPRQVIPRGCKPRPVTSAQFAAACSSTSTMVTSRPVGSLSYHNRPLPTLHLFGGDELEYFPSDSDSERGGGEGSVVAATRQAHSAPTEVAAARRMIRRKGISVSAPRPATITQPIPTTPVDILGSILESQTLMRSRFDIRQDGSIEIHGKSTSSTTPSIGVSPRLNLGQADRLAAQRPSGPSSTEPRDTAQAADRVCTSTSTQANNYTNNTEYQESSATTSTTNVNSTESGFTEQQISNSNFGSPSSNTNKNKASPTSQDDDEEIDIYSDIPNSEPSKEQDSNGQNLSLSPAPAVDAEQFDTSLASFVSSDSETGDVDDDTDDDVVVDDDEDDEEEEEEEGHERMVIDETDAAIQSPPMAIAAPLTQDPVEETAVLSVIPSTQPAGSSSGYGREASVMYGSGSPCYGGGSPTYTAADTVDRLDPFIDELPRTVDVCPNLFTYSAASMELARNCGEEDEEQDQLITFFRGRPVTPEERNDCVPDQPSVEAETGAAKENTTEETTSAVQIVNKRKSIEKPNRRQSLVEEIFGSESEGEGGAYENALPPLPTAPGPEQSAQMTGLEGLDTETISETEEEANFNDPEEVGEKKITAVSQNHYLTTQKPSVSSSSSGKADIDYEEGEIVEDRPRIYQNDLVDVFNTQQINEPPEPLVPTSPVSPEPCNMDNMEAFDNNTPMSPTVHDERPLSRPMSDSRRRDKSPDRRRRRDSRGKKNSKKSENDKLNANIEWKKLSKNSKERNYRDGKAKENVSYERSDKKDKPSRESREDRRSKKKKEKRKDLERYDVRKVINERSRREAERRRRDKFGRDISRERSHSPSPSHSPHNVSRNQSRSRRRTPEADYQGGRSRGRQFRNESWSSNHSHYSVSGSSRGSSPHMRHNSNSSHHRPNNSREDDRNRERRVRPRTISRSPSRSHSMEMARQSRRDQYNQEPRITIVTSHERLTSQGMKTSHIQIPDAVITASMMSSANNAANKKKAEKTKDKKKKDTKKKKKEHHRHVLAPLAPAGSVINNNPSVAGVALSSIAVPEKKKRKREKSPPASKEVFASGDNILVSVNFNKPVMPMQASAASSLAVVPKSKELIAPSIAPPSHMQPSNQKRIVKDNQQLLRSDSHGRPASKRVKRDVGRKMPEHVMCDRSPRRKTNDVSRSALAEKQQLSSQQAPSRKRDDGMKRRKRIAEIAAKRKPVAIIDLESSPFAERAPSPAVVITLSDNEGRLGSSSRSSRSSSVEDNRRSRRRMDKEEQRPRKQRKPSKSDMKGMDRQMPMIAPILNTAPTVALGPKTPPEPQIKFSINAKPQLRSITNPLQDEDDDTELDAANAASMTSRDKSEIDLNNAVNAGLVTSNSGISTLIVSSHSIPNVYRGPNTPPEPQSRSSSCSTTTKLDNDVSKGDSHIPQSPIDAKSPDVYDPFEPTKSPSSDASSLEHQPDISQPNGEDLSQQTHNSMVNASALTPGSMSDNSENSSRLIPQVPESPTPENTVEHPKLQNSHDEEINRKEEAILNKTENVVRPHHIASQVEDEQPRSPVQATTKSAADTVDTSEMKPTSTTTILMPPPVIGTQELFTTLPPSVANILCSQQHPSLYRPQIDATIAAVPLLLSNTLLSLKLSQQALAAASQQQQAQQPAQQQQQQPDTTTTTDVVDMDLESPYSPASSEGDDLFEPPDKPPTPTYMHRNENRITKFSRLAHAKRNATDKFDALFSQSTPLKKEASSTSGNKGTRGRSHAHRTTKGRHTRAEKAESKAAKVGSTQKSRKNANASSTEKSKGKKEISIKMDEDQLKILDDLPSSAVEMQVKEKFLKKLNRQERVVEEVKLALKPHYTKKLVNKEEYKEILRRSVPKICHNKTGEINPIRIRSLVSEYVKKFRYLKKKDSTRSRGKVEKQRKNS